MCYGRSGVTPHTCFVVTPLGLQPTKCNVVFHMHCILNHRQLSACKPLDLHAEFREASSVVLHSRKCPHHCFNAYPFSIACLLPHPVLSVSCMYVYEARLCCLCLHYMYPYAAEAPIDMASAWHHAHRHSDTTSVSTSCKTNHGCRCSIPTHFHW